MRRTTGRIAPAIRSPLPPRVEWYRSVPRSVGLERCDAFRWYENATEVGAVVAAAVKVAPTRRHKPIAHGQAQTHRGECRRMGGVVALHPDEPFLDEQREESLQIDDRARMREGRHAAVTPHQRDRFKWREADARYVRRRFLADERVERAVIRRHVA